MYSAIISVMYLEFPGDKLTDMAAVKLESARQADDQAKEGKGATEKTPGGADGRRGS